MIDNFLLREIFGKSINIQTLETFGAVTAIIIVLAMKLVGTLLISALVIFPALSAMRLFKSFKTVIVFSAAISVLCSCIGILASILLSTPVGSTIVVADLAAFALCWAIGKIRKIDV